MSSGAVEVLEVEGVAAQIYTCECRGKPFVWWHALREDIKENYRWQARAAIARHPDGLTERGIP